ncbi:hypothetical protein EDD80_103108 [Anseongella ginsenosidimutans]|uniref:Cellulase (Glycosyl hydrolase family 5) n=1 Tax=Anseongella ginsenosidimutans TaxID=496056 RepID=A0A4R3KSQ0_9SPHI|nr:hypothetical protein [Anseongella ginsenosidimutans]QEC53363.1 hypothetical protein FRZ59_14120 [Anseongella ginsenosidimutans]TCS88246.1 hypothetical protein EDD80_103108 [Anseongella ginsenosidimutans]
MSDRIIAVVFLLLATLHLSAAGEKSHKISADTTDTGFRLGISGHPLSAVAYNANSSTVRGINYDTQIRMLKDMRLTVYRMDVYTNPAGKSRNHTMFLEMLAKCRENGITVLPMIYDRCRYDAAPRDAYQEGFTQMAGFARLYGKYLSYFELGNEMELFDKLRVSGDGRSEKNYDMQRVIRAEQYIKGMEEGLKSVMPDAKSMVNTAGFLPVFWMDRMFAAAPTIDICAWHVYPEMLPLYKSRFGIENIHAYLYDRYKRPIWYTETNSRARKDLTAAQNEERSYKWRKAFTSGCLADPNVKAVIYHELLDNPERGGLEHANYEEEHFGFVKFNGYPGKDDKAAFKAWKAMPDRYQNWSYRKAALDLIEFTD